MNLELDFAPYVRTSETSKAAALSIAPVLNELQQKVLRYIRATYGATDQEIQTALCMAENTERPRRIELVRAGFVVDSGRTRKTKSGRNAVIWEAT